MLYIGNILHGIELLKRVEYYARVSHRTEDKITDDSYDRFLRSVVMDKGDFSVIEHEKVTVEAEVDRGITHEIVRHRIGSYTQESTRFVNYGKSELRFIKPPVSGGDAQDIYTLWQHSIDQAETAYLLMLTRGISPQIARSVLPNSLASKIIITYNLRAWRHFFIMRTCKEAHPQMREITIPLLHEFQSKIPILYDDIIPNMRQADAMRLLH